MGSESHMLLSAALDGELTPFEMRRFIERAANEPALLQQWSRYHLAQQVRQGGTSAPLVQADLTGRISAALADEPTYRRDSKPLLEESGSGNENGSWWKPVASMAAAASVTAMVILGGQSLTQPDEVDPNLRQNYTIAAVPTASRDYVHARYGDLTSTTVAPQVVSTGQQPQVIRLSQELDRYIAQHRHLLASAAPVWQTQWLPEGFSQVKHEVLPQGEVMLFSDGRHAVSVSVEPLGRSNTAAGVTQSGDVIALGVEKANGFVTVVGDVPLMIADRIAASVNKQQ